MKNSLRHLLIAFVLLISIQYNSKAANVNFILLQPACNNDGVIVMDVSGAFTVFPVYLHYYQYGIHMIDTLTTSFTDTLYNYDGSDFNAYAKATGVPTVYGYFQGGGVISANMSYNHPTCPNPIKEWLNLSGGTLPYTVSWYNQGGALIAVGDTLTTMIPSRYDYVVIDAAGCRQSSLNIVDTGMLWVSIKSPLSISLSSDTANCTNGSAVLDSVSGGIAPYVYLWSNGTTGSSISNLLSGNYVITITDAQGCIGDKYVHVPQSVYIQASVTPTATTCQQSNGSLMGFASGGLPPYTYLWSNGLTTSSINGLAAGYYRLTVTDSHGCFGTTGGVLNTISPVVVTYSATASLCTSSTGTATLQVTGGVPPYNYQWFTSPVQNTAAATNLPPGTYSFLVTDANGCIRDGSVVIQQISSPFFRVYSSLTQCLQSTGTAQVLPVMVISPYTITWNTGQTTNSISGLSGGTYSCQITDANGCAVTKSTTVNKWSPISLLITPDDASCIFIADGTLTASAVGGTAPYTYIWSNGNSTATNANLLKGYYEVQVSDNVGCTASQYVFLGYDVLNDSCYCTITGQVYYDVNANCVKDLGESGIQHILMHLSPYQFSFTNDTGVYSFIVPSGSYSLSQIVQSKYPLSSCQNNLIPLNVTASSGCVQTFDIADSITPLHDVSTYIGYHAFPPIVGSIYHQTMILSNEGTVTESLIASKYSNDGQLQFNGVSPALFVNSGANEYEFSSAGISLAPGEQRVFDLSYYVQPSVPLGTEVVFHDTVVTAIPYSTWLQDYSPWNNVVTYSEIVVGSFDPNSKEVQPKGTGPQGYISTDDSILTFTIHFENTGTWYAQNIEVVDTLDSDLDFSSIHLLYSRGVCNVHLSENGVAHFKFPNINLPPQSSYYSNEGMFVYTIHLKPSLPAGTTIVNKANIYFDYNAPIATNTTLNTIAGVVGIASVASEFSNSIGIYPNPVNDILNVRWENNNSNLLNATMQIVSVDGRVMYSTEVSQHHGVNDLRFSIGSWSPGMYILEINDVQQHQVARFLKADMERK